MTGNEIVKLAEAYVGEGVQTDDLHHRLSPAILTMALAETFTAEQAFRSSAKAGLLEAPPIINDLAEEIPYSWQVCRELLPLWLAWRYFDLDDDTERSALMRAQYEARYAAIVPALWEYEERFNSDGWCCCHE